MALKDFVSTFPVMAVLLVLFVGASAQVSALSDITFMDSCVRIPGGGVSQERKSKSRMLFQMINNTGHINQDVPNTREKNLLKVLGLLFNGKRPLDSLTEETSPASIASLLNSEEASDLTTLLDKLFSSSFYRNHEQAGILSSSSSRQKGDDEVFHVLASKRGRERLSGAMPPLNELCRLMNVQCY